MGKGKKNKDKKVKKDGIPAIDDRPAVECAGKTIKQLIEERLDEYIDELMDDDAVAGMTEMQLSALKHTAAGLTEALAILSKPYYPNIEAIKEEAMDRYAERNG